MAQYHSKILCKDLYAKQIEDENAFFVSEFGTESDDYLNWDWVCPDIEEIEVFNNAYRYQTGTNFLMVVNDCHTAE